VFREKNTVENDVRLARGKASLFHQYAARIFAHEHDLVRQRKNRAIVPFPGGFS
jgi:hypothetical protein